MSRVLCSFYPVCYILYTQYALFLMPSVLHSLYLVCSIPYTQRALYAMPSILHSLQSFSTPYAHYILSLIPSVQCAPFLKPCVFYPLCPVWSFTYAQCVLFIMSVGLYTLFPVFLIPYMKCPVFLMCSIPYAKVLHSLCPVCSTPYAQCIQPLLPSVFYFLILCMFSIPDVHSFIFIMPTVYHSWCPVFFMPNTQYFLFYMPSVHHSLSMFYIPY